MLQLSPPACPLESLKQLYSHCFSFSSQLCQQQIFLSAGATQQWFKYFDTGICLGALCFQQCNSFQHHHCDGAVMCSLIVPLVLTHLHSALLMDM